MDDFRGVMTASRISPEDQHELIKRVAGTHDVIVGK
jgi:hypothetical protein